VSAEISAAESFQVVCSSVSTLDRDLNKKLSEMPNIKSVSRPSLAPTKISSGHNGYRAEPVVCVTVTVDEAK